MIERLVQRLRPLLDDPRMADDYNPETGECDGIPYWERDQSGGRK
jgi:hypothetical protein